MTLFGQQTRKDDPVLRPEPRVDSPVERPPLPTPAQLAPVRGVEDTRTAISRGSESIVAAGLTIEGKIEGSGNVRVAGRRGPGDRIDRDVLPVDYLELDLV